MTKRVQTLAEAAGALAAQPSDLDAWWALALALAADGPKKKRARAFAELGEAASKLGSVGLAVACAIRLIKLDKNRGERLVRSIAERHARGKRSRGRTTAPPMAPPAAAEEPAKELPKARRAALELVDSAQDKAKQAALERQPKSLPPHHLAGALTPEDFAGLVAAARLVSYEAGAEIIVEATPASTLFWVARGTARARRGETVLGELRSNSFFGEIALLSGATRTASVDASEPTWLLEVPAEALEKLAASSPQLATVLARYARSRLLSTVMQTSPLFAQLSDAERGNLLREFESVVVDEGEAIIESGAANDRLYVVVSGACEVRRGSDVVATLVCGDATGEKSLLSRSEAEADVVATERTVLLALSRERFDAALKEHPELLAEVYKLVVEREKDEIIHDAATLVL